MVLDTSLAPSLKGAGGEGKGGRHEQAAGTGAHALEPNDAVKTELAMPCKMEDSEAEGVSTVQHVCKLLCC